MLYFQYFVYVHYIKQWQHNKSLLKDRGTHSSLQIQRLKRIFIASSHSFKRFTSRPFLKISFSLYAPITSDECHAWFHLNASSPAERNMEQVNITKNLVHGRIRTPNTALPSFKLASFLDNEFDTADARFSQIKDGDVNINNTRIRR